MSLESLIVGLLTFGSILLKSNTSAGTFDSQSRYQSGCILPLVEFSRGRTPGDVGDNHVKSFERCRLGGLDVLEDDRNNDGRI